MEQYLYADEYDEDIERDGITDDMYITGGNHGLNLYHGGNFMIERVDE